MEEDSVEAGNMQGIEALNYDSELLKTQQYNDITQKLEAALEKGSDVLQDHGMVLKDGNEYQLIENCKALSADIEDELFIIQKFIGDKYPQLESLVQHRIDYAPVVKNIGNSTLVDMEGVLPAKIRMIISLIASTTSGKPLPDEVLQKTIEACDRALALYSAKKKVFDFFETRMTHIAPSLSALVGSAVAARLMVNAGGLKALVNMSARHVQLLGAMENLAGFSTSSQSHVGYIEQMDVVQSRSLSLRRLAGRILVERSLASALLDSIGGDPSGDIGRALRKEACMKIENLPEPLAKPPKPLPVTISDPKKKRLAKRFARRVRKMMERPDIAERLKRAGRMQFGVPEESYLGDGLRNGYGLLGQAGNGEQRVSVCQSSC